LFVYAIAFGVNNGILSREKYMPIIENGWSAIKNRVYMSMAFWDMCSPQEKNLKKANHFLMIRYPILKILGWVAFYLRGAKSIK